MRRQRQLRYARVSRAGRRRSDGSHIGATGGILTSAPFVLERAFDAPRDRVWTAMTDAEHLKRWFGPPGGLSDATVDLREGGVFVYGIVVPGAADLRAKRTFAVIKP